MIHRETREFPVYALVVTKNGPKFKPGDGGPLSVAPDSDGGFYYKNYTMEALAESLSLMTSVARPVKWTPLSRPSFARNKLSADGVGV